MGVEDGGGRARRTARTFMPWACWLVVRVRRVNPCPFLYKIPSTHAYVDRWYYYTYIHKYHAEAAAGDAPAHSAVAQDERGLALQNHLGGVFLLYLFICVCWE